MKGQQKISSPIELDQRSQLSKLPSPSLSKRAKASLNSATCSSVNWAASVMTAHFWLSCLESLPVYLATQVSQNTGEFTAWGKSPGRKFVWDGSISRRLTDSKAAAGPRQGRRRMRSSKGKDAKFPSSQISWAIPGWLRDNLKLSLIGSSIRTMTTDNCDTVCGITIGWRRAAAGWTCTKQGRANGPTSNLTLTAGGVSFSHSLWISSLRGDFFVSVVYPWLCHPYFPPFFIMRERIQVLRIFSISLISSKLGSDFSHLIWWPFA